MQAYKQVCAFMFTDFGEKSEAGSTCLVRRLGNSVGDFGVESELNIDEGSRFLQVAEGLNEWFRHALALSTDLEVLEGAGRGTGRGRLGFAR
jgi:hypothetical protein